MNQVRKPQARRGATLVFTAFMLVLLITMVAFAVDVGRMYLVRTQMQTAVDAGAIAAAQYLSEQPDDMDGAIAAATDFVQKNRVGSITTIPAGAIVAEAGTWDHAAKSFTVNSQGPDCIRVFARAENERLFLAPFLGVASFSAPRSAIASLGGRNLDIIMLLDLSGSMGSQGRVQALQTAAPAFVDVIDNADGDDRIGVLGFGALIGSYDPAANGHAGAVYTSTPSSEYPAGSNWAAVLEAPLTLNLSGLKTSTLNTTTLVANKYNGWTPTGAAIRDGAHYLNANARSDAGRAIVLMSDGKANKPDGLGPQYAMQMAAYAASFNIKVYTISLGNGADEQLMESIASATKGQHFEATGSGQALLTDKLTKAFERAAAAIKSVELVQ